MNLLRSVSRFLTAAFMASASSLGIQAVTRTAPSLWTAPRGERRCGGVWVVLIAELYTQYYRVIHYVKFPFAFFSGGAERRVYNKVMANQRSANQKLLAFTLSTDLADAVDRVSGQRGMNRSEFIRRAAVNYLQSIGEPVPDSLAFAPDRRLRLADEPEISDFQPAPKNAVPSLTLKCQRRK